MRFLAYGWRVLINVGYLAVALYILDKASKRPDVELILATLGLIYATMRSIAIGQAFGSIAANSRVLANLIVIREHLEDDRATLAATNLDEELRQAAQDRVSLYIEGVFLTLLSLLCAIVAVSSANRIY